MTDVHGVAVEQLRSYVERIERLEEEIRGLNEDKRDVYAEAKSMGFDVKAMKRVISERRKEVPERQEQEALFDLYWDALHGSAPAPRSTPAPAPARAIAETVPTQEPQSAAPVTTQETADPLDIPSFLDRTNPDNVTTRH